MSDFSRTFAFSLDEPVEVPTGVPQGTVLDEDAAYPLAAISTLDPRQAMANTLACYVGNADFVRDGGTAPDTVFRLEAVFSEWPDAEQELPYPCASIVDKGPIPYDGQNFTPVPIESTLEVFCPNTVLWKTAEAMAEFQVDYWANDKNTRRALASRITSLFSPGENRNGVILQGDPKYFDRRMRAWLVDHERPDDEDTVYSRERRVRTTVRCEIDVVQLRQAVPLMPRTHTVVEES